MTREEQLDWLWRLHSEIEVFMPHGWVKPMKEALSEMLKTQMMVDKSNFSQEQYRTDLQSAFDCGKASVECKDCRTCNKWSECECGEKGHKNGTSISYSVGECKDYEPCDDCVSRHEVMCAINSTSLHYELARKLRKLPPVTPKQKMGRWGILEECSNEGIYCSVCHKKVHRLDFVRKVKFKYCPNCGAKMFEPQTEGSENE